MGTLKPAPVVKLVGTPSSALRVTLRLTSGSQNSRASLVAVFAPCCCARSVAISGRDDSASFFQRLDRGDRSRHFERIGGLDRRAARSAEDAVERRAGGGDGAVVGEEIVLGLRQVGLRLDDVDARHCAAEEARLRLFHKVRGELFALLQIFAVSQRDEDRVVRLRGLRRHLLPQLRQVELRGAQVGGRDVAPQSALAGERKCETDSLIASVARGRD